MSPRATGDGKAALSVDALGAPASRRRVLRRGICSWHKDKAAARTRWRGRQPSQGELQECGRNSRLTKVLSVHEPVWQSGNEPEYPDSALVSGESSGLTRDLRIENE